MLISSLQSSANQRASLSPPARNWIPSFQAFLPSLPSSLPYPPLPSPSSSSSISLQPSLSRQRCYYCLSSYTERLTSALWDINLCSYWIYLLFVCARACVCSYYHTEGYQSGAWRRYVLLHMKWWLTDIVFGLAGWELALLFLESRGAR